MDDSRTVKAYKKFEEAFNLDRRTDKKFDFKFGSLEYWNVSRQYLEYVERKEDNGANPTNSLFAYYYVKLSDGVKLILN
tara:strand:- start:2502 stop:2738 length:237 start_codon:yes stop_codon:yes gene_type:complete